MKLSARNQLKGKVKSIDEGVITASVKLELASGDVVTAIISKESVQELGLAVGEEATAVIKATEVLVAK